MIYKKQSGKLNLIFKLLYLNSNFALNLGYLNPALNNPTQTHPRTYKSSTNTGSEKLVDINKYPACRNKSIHVGSSTISALNWQCHHLLLAMRPLHHLHIRVWQKHCLIAGPCRTTPSELLCFYNKLLDRYDAMMDKLAVTLHKMERIVLSITLQDRKRNIWIHQETGVSNIINAIRKAEHRWAGQIAQLSNNGGTIRATEWTKRDWTRKIRWRENLTRQFVPVWSRLTKHRRLWDRSREEFLCQEWMQTLIMMMMVLMIRQTSKNYEDKVNVRRLVGLHDCFR